MAYTQDDINGAREWAKGKTGAEISSRAAELGVSASDFGTILGYTPDQVKEAGYGTAAGLSSNLTNEVYGGFNAYSPGNTVAANVNGQKFTDIDYANWREMAAGKDLDTILGAARENGLSTDNVAAALGYTPEQVYNWSGYGRGMDSQPGGTTVHNQYGWGSADNPNDPTKKLVNGNAMSDYIYNADGTITYIGGTKPAPAPSPVAAPAPSPVAAPAPVPVAAPAANPWIADAPGTGINLNQIQQAVKWDVNPNQTVQSQLDVILAKDSPLMQRAAAKALQAANERGLMNSSMAVTAGQAALYDAAMPIAQQDAGTYADSARFNADSANQFGRDNNAFVRDAYMADFNVAANEWAAGQAFDRDVAKMSLQQRQTLERDAVQNGYQSARDAVLNGYTIARDNLTNNFTLTRDNNQNTFTAGENAQTREFNAQQAELDRVAAANRAAMGIQPDTSVQRTAMQIAAERDSTAIARINDANLNIAKFKSDYATKVANITADPNISPEKAAASVQNLTATYQPIISSLAISAGLDPTVATAGMTYTPIATSSTATTGTTGGSGASMDGA